MIYGQNAIRKKNESLNFLKVDGPLSAPRRDPAWRGSHSPTAAISATHSKCNGSSHEDHSIGEALGPTFLPSLARQLGSRLDAVVSRLETQAKMNLINKSFAGIVKSLEKALSTSNLEQVSRSTRTHVESACA